MGSTLMSQFNWLLLFVYINVAAVGLIFALLPVHFSFWRRWIGIRSKGISVYRQPGWLAMSFFAIIFVLSWGVAGFLTAKLYYVDIEYATPASAPVAGFPFAIAYNAETSWASGTMGIYFNTRNSQYWTVAQSMFLGSLGFYVMWSYLFFAHHRTTLSLIAVTIAAAAAVVGSVFMWLLSWIPGIVSVFFPLWLIYAWIVNIAYVHKKQTIEGKSDEDMEARARWVNDEGPMSIKSGGASAAAAAKAAVLQQAAAASASTPAPSYAPGYAPAHAQNLQHRTGAAAAAAASVAAAASAQAPLAGSNGIPLNTFY